MRVCFVTDEFGPAEGGIGRSAERITAGLARGAEIHVVAPAHKGAQPGVKHSGGVTLHRVPMADDRLGAFRVAMERLDRDLAFDLFHGFVFHLAHPCLRVAGTRPVIASIRGSEAQYFTHPSYEPMAATVLRGCARITSVSSDSLRKAAAVLPASEDPSARCVFIPNAVDWGGLPRWRLECCRRGLVGTVATFRVKKDLPALVRAYGAIPGQLRRGLRLVGCYTSPPGVGSRAGIEGAIEECDVGGEVAVTGYLPRAGVAENLCAMHVFVLSSLHEGMPNAILEAAACGVPIVATAVDGVRDIFRDGESALLVSPGDVAGMTRAIMAVLSSDTLAQRLSAGASAVASRLTPEAEGATWLDLYRGCVTH